MTDQSTRKRGRPRTKPAGEVHVSVPIPQWLLEHIDAIGRTRGRTVAALAMQRLLELPHIQNTPGAKDAIEMVLYG